MDHITSSSDLLEIMPESDRVKTGMPGWYTLEELCIKRGRATDTTRRWIMKKVSSGEVIIGTMIIDGKQRRVFATAETKRQ